MKGGKLQNEERTFFSFASHFSKPRKFVLGLPNWKFSTRKKHFTRREKMTLPPQEKFSCYVPEIVFESDGHGGRSDMIIHLTGVFKINRVVGV